jgi:hypothetical protein
METSTAQTEGMPSMGASDFVYEAFKGAGKVGGYLHNVLADTIYYAGKYVAYFRDVCSNCQVPLFAGRREESKVTLVRLVKSEAGVDEADKKEFYMNFGRDMVAVTKSGLESENLTIIDLSKYEL